MIRGSYYNGFAPRDGMPLYPSLWRGCVGAWAPCLGPTGLNLRDWSGYRYDATVNNGTVWTVSGGAYATSYDGVDDSCSVVSNRFLASIGASDFSFSFWCYLRSQGEGSLGTVCDNYVSTSGGFYTLNRGVSGNTLAVQAGLSHTTDLTHISADNVFRLDTWDHFVVSFSFANLSFSLFRNGAAISFPRVSTPSGTPVSQTRTMFFGNRSATDRTFDGLLDDLRFYSRALNVNEIALLASRRGIAYDLAPFRMPYSEQVAGFQAAWALRQRLILGGGGGLG